MMSRFAHVFPVVCSFCLFLSAPALASVGSLRLTSYPKAVMADGKSLVNLSIEVRDRDGKFVADGTEVTLSTTLGRFREPVVRTSNGVARGVLVSGNVAGMAKVTATVPGYAIVGELEVQFADDRRAISSASDYIEIGGKDYLTYFTDIKWAAAMGKDQKAFVKYRDIAIFADDLQVDVSAERVIARKARLKVGKNTLDCEQLSYELRARKGVAVTEVEGKPQIVGLTNAEIGPKPQEFSDAWFMLRDDLDTSAAYITSNHVTVFPSQKVQFHRANVYVADTKVVSLPLYSMDMYNEGGQIFASNMIGFNDGQFSLDLPFYYMLTPQGTGALRISTQQRNGRGLGASHGIFLNLEQNYSQADKYDGQLVFSDIIRNDWSASWRHSHHFDDNTQGYFMVDFPEHKGAFASANINKQFNGYHAGLNLSHQRQFEGFDPANQRYDFFLETEPVALKGTPFSNSLSFTTSYNTLRAPDGQSSTESGMGLRWRSTMNSIDIGNFGSVRGGFTVSKLFGGKSSDGVDVLATVASSFRIPKLGFLSLTYDFAHDNFSSNILGSHRVSGALTSAFGAFQLGFSGSASLDADYMNFFADASMRLTPLLRLGLSYTYSNFNSFGLTDYGITLGYRIGLREVGLSWSQQTKKISIELLSTQF